MDDLLEAFKVLLTLSLYGGMGTGAGVLMYRVLVTRGNAPGSENLGPAALMTGVFWPVGLWIAIALYITTPKLSHRDAGEVRRRKNNALREAQLLEADKMQLQVDIGRRRLELEREQFHDATMRSIQARDDR